MPSAAATFDHGLAVCMRRIRRTAQASKVAFTFRGLAPSQAMPKSMKGTGPAVASKQRAREDRKCHIKEKQKKTSQADVPYLSIQNGPPRGRGVPDIVPEHVTRSFEERFLKMEREVLTSKAEYSEKLKNISNIVDMLSRQTSQTRLYGGSYAEGRHDEWMTWKRWAALPEDVRPPSPVEPRLRLA